MLLLLERLPAPANHIDPLEQIAAARADGHTLIMATVYEANDQPHRVGQRITLTTAPGGNVLQSDPGVSSGLIAALRTSLDAAPTWRRPRSVSVDTDQGQITALVEAIAPPPQLLILGAGDDAQPLAAMASTTGWRVQVADKWPALATAARFPTAQVTCAPIEGLLADLKPNAHTYAVVMTHSFNDDLILLPDLLRSEVAWIGLMGPRRRTMNLMRTLVADGRLPDPEALARVQTPVGLDLGADAPEEVAVSILGGVVAARNGRAGGLLRDRNDGAIHEPHTHIRATHPKTQP
ncbi:MAG: XdhC family protein [Myxococcota bacterium]